jgi:PucR C-terminal helix-turn-helix domain
VVHPNTVVYRLRRIRELTGRDPRIMDELVVLFLALKLAELKPPLRGGREPPQPLANAGADEP